MSTPLVFADDVERAGWFAVYAATMTAPLTSHGRERYNGPSAEADRAVAAARSRRGRDLQAENAQLRQELVDARATIDQLRDELAQLDSREAADAMHDTAEHL